MKKYIIVQDVGAERLEYAVNDLLSRGWLLVGGVAFVNTGMGLRWAQAMITDTAEAAGGEEWSRMKM